MKNEIINIFDFDGTLTTQTWPKFWVWVKKFGYDGVKKNNEFEKALEKYSKENMKSGLEAFFGFFNHLLVSNNETITYGELMEGEKYIEYNPGVIEYIKSTNAKNYIVSGGVKEFLQRLRISRYFDGIYGTSVKFNKYGTISQVDEIMTDDKKILAIIEILNKNNIKAYDCSNVNYIGDGCTDAMAMEFVHNHGGKAIFVHQPNENDVLYSSCYKIYQELNSDGMVDFYCTADYTNGSMLSNVLNGMV